MRDKRIPHVRTVEEEARWLDDLGLDAEEKIAILELMMESCSSSDRELMKETIDSIRIEKYILGVEDK
jgi:hypothetical protein